LALRRRARLDRDGCSMKGRWQISIGLRSVLLAQGFPQAHVIQQNFFDPLRIAGEPNA
jgi:hypothetical protein